MGTEFRNSLFINCLNECVKLCRDQKQPANLARFPMAQCERILVIFIYIYIYIYIYYICIIILLRALSLACGVSNMTIDLEMQFFSVSNMQLLRFIEWLTVLREELDADVMQSTNPIIIPHLPCINAYTSFSPCPKRAGRELLTNLFVIPPTGNLYFPHIPRRMLFN